MKDEQKGNGWIIAIVAIAIVLLLCLCGGKSDYEKNARSGFDKWSSGDYNSMTQDEKKAVNDYLKWSNEN